MAYEFKGPTIITKNLGGSKDYFFIVRYDHGKEEYLSIGMNRQPKWVTNFNFASTYLDAESAQAAYDLLMKDYKESESVVIRKEIKVPGTNIILEAGDKVKYIAPFNESASLSELNDIASGLQAYLKKNKEFYSVYPDVKNSAVCIDVEWGDWKHDHLHLDSMVAKYFDSAGIDHMTDEKVTDEDGSDTYSSTHIYHII